MKIKKYLPIIGIAIFVYLLVKLDISNILNEIKNAKILFLLIAGVLTIFLWVTSTLKWYVIAIKQGINVPFFEAFKINLINTFFYGFITPSRVGSALRFEYLKKFSRGRIGVGISNYVLEKIIDVSTLLLLALFSSLIFFILFGIEDIFINQFFIYTLIISLIMAVFVSIFLNENNSKRILKIFYIKILPQKVKEYMRDGFYSFYEDMPKKKNFILFFAVNMVNWLILFSILFFIGKSIGIGIPDGDLKLLLFFILFMPIVTLISQIPITISGLGTREAAMISLFGLLGISATKIFSMSIIGLFINGIIPACIGLFLVIYSKKFMR